MDRAGKQMDLTTGSITGKLLRFALPLMAGNVLQQFYNIADTLIVGRFLGADALAAVGSAYTLMTFLSSILLGLCMGASAYFAIQFGRKNMDAFKKGVFLAFVMIGGTALLLSAAAFAGLDWIIPALQVPGEIQGMMREYLAWIFLGIVATFLYNFYANLLRGVGNSFAALLFLGVAVALNVGLDLLFVVGLGWGVRGAAAATVAAQYASGIGLALYSHFRFPQLRPERRHCRWDSQTVKSLFNLSFLTCLQQSLMNFGILLVQGLVNSFGTVVMAAFAAAVKIDTVAYMPVQDFGNAFSTFAAQNHGAKQQERIRQGIKSSLLCVLVFCAGVSLAVCLLAGPLMEIFVGREAVQVVGAGAEYLRIEAAFYFGIGLLFLLYGYYRAIEKPGMSLALTICSLGTRVALAYGLSAIPSIGVTGIWASIPIGWFLADGLGVGYYGWMRRKEALLLRHLPQGEQQQNDPGPRQDMPQAGKP